MDSVRQGLKPLFVLLTFVARLKPCPCYKTHLVTKLIAQGFPAACKATLSQWTLFVRLKRLRKNSPHQAMVRRRVREGLKPLFVLLTLAARLKPCPCYKTYLVTKLIAQGFPAACKATLSQWTLFVRLKRLRKNSPHQAMVRRRVQQGLKPPFVLLTFVARLKPCPCYKTYLVTKLILLQKLSRYKTHLVTKLIAQGFSAAWRYRHASRRVKPCWARSAIALASGSEALRDSGRSSRMPNARALGRKKRSTSKRIST